MLRVKSQVLTTTLMSFSHFMEYVRESVKFFQFIPVILDTYKKS